MNKATRMKQINALLFIFFVFQLVTGALLGLTGSEAFEVAHPLGGAILAVLGCIHIGLNWGWVRSAFSSRK
jgi:hypothetical protein